MVFLPGNTDWARLDALLEDLPPGLPLLPPEDAGNFEKYTHRPRNAYVPGDGWKNCARALEKYDAELCKGYREEIDTLLVFAGLFSAVVTAFTIESYKWLQDDANDVIVVILSQIAQSVSPNSTAAPLISASGGIPRSVGVLINVFWFLALALSLSAALVAILCKQWIREFERNVGLSPRLFVGIHHTKLEGLEKWRVGGIISLLPLLLQLALALFALGVLQLLWHLHSAVAVVVCVPTVIALVFYLATTVLPAVTYPRLGSESIWQKLPECPYKSPQASLAFPIFDIYLWMQHECVRGVTYSAYLLSLAWYKLVRALRLPLSVLRPSFGHQFNRRLQFTDHAWHSVSWHINNFVDREYEGNSRPLSIFGSLRWMHMNLDDGDIREWIWRCLWETEHTSYDQFIGSARAIQRGLSYAAYGSTEVPHWGIGAPEIYYMLRTPLPPPFTMEVVIQNLHDMDYTSANRLTAELRSMSALRSDPLATVSILRVACVYVRSRLREPLGELLFNLTNLAIDCIDPQLRRVLPACSLTLYLNWLYAHPEPHQFRGIETTEWMMFAHCTSLLVDSEAYYLHPDRLRHRPDARALAALVARYAQNHEDPAAALAAGFAFDEGKMRVIVSELLDMAYRSFRLPDPYGRARSPIQRVRGPAPPDAHGPPAAFDLSDGVAERHTARSDVDVALTWPPHSGLPNLRSHAAEGVSGADRAHWNRAQMEEERPHSQARRHTVSCGAGQAGVSHDASGEVGIPDTPVLRDVVSRLVPQRVSQGYGADAALPDDAERENAPRHSLDGR